MPTSPSIDPTDHLDLVVKEAWRWHWRRLGPVEDSDAYSIACIGLMLAVRDYRGGIPFRPYVATIIRRTLINDYWKQRQQRRNPSRCKPLDHDPVDHRSSGIKAVDDRDEIESGVRFRYIAATDLSRFIQSVVYGDNKTTAAKAGVTTEHFIRRSLWRVRHHSAKVCPVSC